ncbi:GNAT family N-acetyltransferase [Nocardia sp. NPDC020380]|uniref:GNAT family N-acetyltransferase n=1 Tax=Nocardia sp. NPDC020380 TaxID=3364309 RepID=UPI0037A68A50
MFSIALGADGARLCPLEPWQAEEFLAHLDRGREFIGQYIAFADRATDLDSSRALLRAYADKAATDTGRIYGIWSDDVLVGGVLFRRMDFEHGVVEVGCWLEPAAIGKGLATRAARVIIDWAVRTRGAHRVEWQVKAGNLASIAVARRLGMTLDGVLREAMVHHGNRFDVEVWSILAPQWRALSG